MARALRWGVPPRAAEYPGGIRAYHPGGIRAYHPGLAVPADDEPQRPTKPAAAQACDHGVVEPPVAHVVPIYDPRRENADLTFSSPIFLLTMRNKKKLNT